MRWLALIFVSVLTAAATAACGTGAPGEASAESRDAAALSGEITVLAASSLAVALDDLAEAFVQHAGAQAQGVRVRASLAGSAVLRLQILAGAPADVFISASSFHIEAVERELGLAAAAQEVAQNSLVLAVPRGNPGEVATLDDLSRSDLLIGLCAEAVPCGAAVRAALFDLAIVAAPDTETSSVAALATQLAAGELDAAVIYLTNALELGDAVEVIDWNSRSDDPMIVLEPPANAYFAATLADSANPSLAHAFVDFLTSDAAQEVFAGYGFVEATAR